MSSPPRMEVRGESGGVGRAEAGCRERRVVEVEWSLRVGVEGAEEEGEAEAEAESSPAARERGTTLASSNPSQV